MAQFSETIDYTKKSALHSSYRWMRLNPVGSGGGSITLSTTATTIVNFEIPANVINLSKSKLCFDSLFAAGGAGLVHVVDGLGFSQFDRIQLSTRSGVILASADNMTQFAHIISKLKNKFSSLADNTVGSTAIDTTTATSSLHPFSDISKNNTGSSGSFRGTSLVVPISSISAGVPAADTIYIPTLLNHRSAYRVDGTLMSTPFLEPLSIISQDAANTALAVSWQMELGGVKDTILEVNKSLWFGDNLILTLQWNPTTKFSGLANAGVLPVSTTGLSGAVVAGVVGTQFTNASGATTAALPATSPVNATPNQQPLTAQQNGAVAQSFQQTLSNIFLYVPIETDPVIVSQLMNKVNTDGFTLTVPYVYSTKTSVTSAATSFSMQQRVTRGYGQRLLRCYSAMFNGASTLAGLTHSDALISSYNTSLDGIRLQDFPLRVADSTHWLVNEPLIRDSCYLTLEQFKNQAFHCDSWTGKAVAQEDDTVDNGLSLDADKTYGISYDTITAAVATQQHYLWFVVQRTLSIKGNQIIMV